jgi:hypothetical protein
LLARDEIAESAVLGVLVEVRTERGRSRDQFAAEAHSEDTAEVGGAVPEVDIALAAGKLGFESGWEVMAATAVLLDAVFH